MVSSPLGDGEVGKQKHYSAHRRFSFVGDGKWDGYWGWDVIF